MKSTTKMMRTYQLLIILSTLAFLTQACYEGYPCFGNSDCCSCDDQKKFVDFCACQNGVCKYCFHESTKIVVLRNIVGDHQAVTEEISIKDVKFGDLVATYDEKKKHFVYQPIVVKLTHEADGNLSPLQVLEYVDLTSGKVGKLEVSPSHYVYVLRPTATGEEELLHIQSQQALVGDLFMIRTEEPERKQFASLINVSTRFVPNDELISVYTPSRTIVANDILASCVNEDDGSELSIPILSFLGKYIHNGLPTKIAEFGQMIGMKTIYIKGKKALSYIPALF